MDHYYWMYKAPRMSKPYLNGVENFISVAEANRVNNGSRSISCPCNNCKNFLSFIDTGEIEYHLLHDGFVPNYTCWSRHGESLHDCSTSSNNLHSNENTFNNDSYLDDDDHHSNDRNDNFNEMFDDMETNMGADEQEKLHRLFDEAETPLYKGSRFMKLDVVLKLLNLKLKHGWSDKSFTSLLELLHDLFPEDNGLPISTYQAKKLMCPMGLEVERIHACPNICMLFRKEFENKHNCVSCGASRYKRKKDSDEADDDVTKNGPPAKMLWYLPIIPRLKRLFSNENEAKLLCWHSEERVIDGKLRHVADSPQWRNIDNKYPEFGNEMRNIRFGLSSDGINPFGNMSSRHSTWPVLLCIYNLPPWLCMKRKYIMMSLLIQAPTQPGNDIDVYMSPLIDDLKTLWSSGVDVYDAYKKEQFQLRAMIFCTISDFPAYGNLSGYKTKGKKDCPVCEDMTSSICLKNCKKTVYMGHRRFLPKGHRYRKNTIEFDGTVEIRTMRTRFDAFSRVENVNVVLGKRFRIDKDALWKKRSIFFELPYWRHLDVRHCLDVMHIEKNVPSTYSANIKRFVSMKDYKLIGMKSHDCHVLMTHMIPIAIRGILDDDIRHTVTKLCYVRNRNRPEGSIVEGYTSEEVVEFCQVFRCKWVNNRTGVQVDKYGFTLVDLTTNGYASEPFVLAKHVAQVFFVKDPSKARYHVVLQGKRRILGVDNVVDEEEYDHFDDLPPFLVVIYSKISSTVRGIEEFEADPPATPTPPKLITPDNGSDGISDL
ncbi:hypothetical protein LXL04_006929 [Taraxacum kok-saghyz]